MKIYHEIAKDDPVLYAQFKEMCDEIESLKARIKKINLWLSQIQQTLEEKTIVCANAN